nr:GNAT family N-acetyltransferase [Microlunatus panaciterrae]
MRAWRPVFESFERVLGPEIYQRIYPDWLTSQAAAVRGTCDGPHVWVAATSQRPVGFVAVDVRGDDARSAEVDMIAVDPDHQRKGVATALITHALDQLRSLGVAIADIGTGGDPGHAAARRTYEKAGFTALPLVRYYKVL